MLYNGKQMLLDEYYSTRMKEAGFVDNDLSSVNGAERTETEFAIIADYYSSCEFDLSEIEFIESLGYAVEDFTGKRLYEVTIESPGGIRRVLHSTNDYKDALLAYEAYNNGSGDFVDCNEFVWDLYIDDFNVE